MREQTVYIGIDPGKTGGISVLLPDGSRQFFTIPVIGKEVDLKEFNRIIASLITDNPDHWVGLERVHAVPGSGAAQTFEFGWICGVLEAILVANNARWEHIAPKTWQKVIWEGVPKQVKSSGGTDTKSTSLIAAQRWFPDEKFLPPDAGPRKTKAHDGLVDAALIAAYMRYRHGKTQQ